MSNSNKRVLPLLGFALALATGSGQSLAVSADALRHPMSPKARKALQKVTDFYLAGDDAAMEHQLDSAMELPEAAPYALKMKGLLDLNKKDFPAAESELTQAATALPWDAEAEALLGYTFYQAGDLTTGADAARKSLGIDPNQPLAHMVIGLLQWEGKQVESGLQHLKTAASLGLLPAQVLLANYHARTGQPALAQQEWRLVERDVNLIEDPRVRRDTQRWVIQHQEFGQVNQLRKFENNSKPDTSFSFQPRSR